MATKKIIMEIDEQGDPTVTVEGVKGASCNDLTKSLEAALGGTVVEKRKTKEAYEKEKQGERVRM
jgi:hypothetical protein